MTPLPTVFLSHGSPMHAIEPGIAGRAWESLGRTLPRPRAVLIASAHWETSVPMLTGNPKPQTIHDFGGFPAGALRAALSRARRAGARHGGRRAAEARRHHRGCRRLPRHRSRRVGAAPVDVSGARRSGRAGLGAAGARNGASRRARTGARAARGRRRADRRLGPHDAQPARLDGQSAPYRAAALRAGIRRVGQRAPRGDTTPRR